MASSQEITTVQPSSESAALRRTIYGLLIAIAFAMACGRIVSAQRVYEPSLARDENKAGDRRPPWPKGRPDPMPTFGSNDRSRWATIRALVHDHTYVIGKREPQAIWTSAAALFGTADPLQAAVLVKVGYDLRTDTSNRSSHQGIIFKDKEKEHAWGTIDRVMNPETLEFYSSKPPLLATLLSGIYWIFYTLFGWSLVTTPNTVVRAMLLLVNALPFAGYLWLLAQVVERWGKTDWGKLYIVAAGAFATLVTPFLITLNNHTFGTFAVMVAWWSVLCVWEKVATQEAPAWQHFASAGFFAAFAVTNELPVLSFAVAIFGLLLWWCPRQGLLWFVPAALLPALAFFATNYAAIGQFRPAYAEFGGPWYEYEGSHWSKPPEGQIKHGIDWAKYKETRAQYALHMLIGHHGLFSLSPIWLLAVAAMLAGCWRGRAHWQQAVFRTSSDFPWFVQPLGLALTVVVVGFYLYKSDNYAGWSNGLRWLMWLTPIWLTCLIPLADRLAPSRWGRWLAVILLAISVFSVSYELWNPWRHPWIYDLMLELGWPGY